LEGLKGRGFSHAAKTNKMSAFGAEGEVAGKLYGEGIWQAEHNPLAPEDVAREGAMETGHEPGRGSTGH